MVSITSAGYERVDTKAMKAHGIRVGLAGSAATIATAELAVALLLCVSRRLFSAPQLYKRYHATRATASTLYLNIHTRTLKKETSNENATIPVILHCVTLNETCSVHRQDWRAA